MTLPSQVEFLAQLAARLDAGAITYGDKSFERPFATLLDELEQEALDLAGWGYVTWERVRRVRELAQRVDEITEGSSARIERRGPNATVAGSNPAPQAIHEPDPWDGWRPIHELPEDYEGGVELLAERTGHVYRCALGKNHERPTAGFVAWRLARRHPIDIAQHFARIRDEQREPKP